jgi:hypothetical protein
MSGEHLVSRNQYGDADSITVQGLSWCPQPKVISLSSAVANILCKTHNEALSPVDSAAKDALTGLSLMRDRSEDKMPPIQFPMRRFTVSGDLFERWLLKTTINVAMVGKPRPEAGIFEAGGVVAKRYVEIAYGLAQFDLEEGCIGWSGSETGSRTATFEASLCRRGSERATAPWSRLRSDTTDTTFGLPFGGRRRSSTRCACEPSTATTRPFRSTSPGRGRYRGPQARPRVSASSGARRRWP